MIRSYLSSVFKLPVVMNHREWIPVCGESSFRPILSNITRHGMGLTEAITETKHSNCIFFDVLRDDDPFELRARITGKVQLGTLMLLRAHSSIFAIQLAEPRNCGEDNQGYGSISVILEYPQLVLRILHLYYP